MVRIFKLSWLIMAVAISLVLISCGGNSSSNNNNWEDHSNNKCNGEQVREENSTNENNSRSTKEDKTFTTSKGTFLLDEAINWSYEFGFEQGTSDQSNSYPSYAYDTSKGMFKSIWIARYGVPSTPDAEEAFKTCRDNFNKGLDEGFRDDL